jgi:hypothetical protein
MKLQRYNKINDIIKRNVGTQMSVATEVLLKNTTSTAGLNYGK